MDLPRIPSLIPEDWLLRFRSQEGEIHFPSYKAPSSQQRPSFRDWNIVSDDQEQGFGTKLNHALHTIDHAVNTAHSLGLMDDEEQKINIDKALKRVTKVAVKASEMGLLDENDQQPKQFQ